MFGPRVLIPAPTTRSDQLAEQRQQDGAVVVGEPVEEGLTDTRDLWDDAAQQVVAFWRHPQDIAPAVLGVAATAEQAALFQPPADVRERRRVDRGPRGERPLIQIRLPSQWVQERTDVRVTESYGAHLPDEIVREAARQMLAIALQAECRRTSTPHAEEVDENGHRLVVRNGRHHEREVITAAGPVPVRAPRVNDKRTDPAARFRSR
jgi:hypothetical protein